jgi:hypothetical protein
MLVRIVPNTDGITFRPYTSTDEAVLRSFGGYDVSDPSAWTIEQYREFGRLSGLRFVRPS